MKRSLVTLLSWHASAVDADADVWDAGRFLERWADPERSPHSSARTPTTTSAMQREPYGRRSTSSRGSRRRRRDDSDSRSSSTTRI